MKEQGIGSSLSEKGNFRILDHVQVQAALAIRRGYGLEIFPKTKTTKNVEKQYFLFGVNSCLVLTPQKPRITEGKDRKKQVLLPIL